MTLSAINWGTAPAPYPTTLAEDGARHIIFPDLPGAPGFYLGSTVSGATDGTPSVNGDSDDDGVVFEAPLQIGQPVTVQVTVSGAGTGIGKIDAWIDFNGDGDWSDAFEHVTFLTTQNNVTLVNGGVNDLTFTVPADAKDGYTYARFRLTKSSDPAVSYTGEAPDGEVEDYHLRIVTNLECWGIAPAPYPTLLADNGASHELDATKPHLGPTAVAQPDGQPGATDSDEDGVKFDATTPLIPGQVAHLTVNTYWPASYSGPGSYLSAWIDFTATAPGTPPIRLLSTRTPR